MLSKKSLILHLLIITFISMIFFSFIFLSFFRPTQPTPQPSFSTKPSLILPSPQIDTENLQFHPDENIVAQTTDQEAQEMLDKDATIGQLLPKLPYQGTFFSLEYDYSTNIFTVNFSASNQAQANQEFDQFLKSNQIQNKNWLYNLKIDNL